MAGSRYEKEMDAGDPVADANRPLDDEREPVDDENEIAKDAALDKDVDEEIRPVTAQSEGEERPADLDRMKSYATETSVATGAPSNHGTARNKWYQKVNPLRWGGVPPVPTEREISREYKANFLSKLIFSWQAPLMSVSGVRSGPALAT
jgi:hypothetical protein